MAELGIEGPTCTKHERALVVHVFERPRLRSQGADRPESECHGRAESGLFFRGGRPTTPDDDLVPNTWVGRGPVWCVCVEKWLAVERTIRGPRLDFANTPANTPANACASWKSLSPDTRSLVVDPKEVRTTRRRAWTTKMDPGKGGVRRRERKQVVLDDDARRTKWEWSSRRRRRRRRRCCLRRRSRWPRWPSWPSWSPWRTRGRRRARAWPSPSRRRRGCRGFFGGGGHLQAKSRAESPPAHLSKAQLAEAPRRRSQPC